MQMLPDQRLVAAIITNPDSRFNRRHLPRLRRQLARHPHIVHLEVARQDDLPAALAGLAGRHVELLGINGGDGTVHAILTALHTMAGPRPVLALLPGGTTNMSSNDINGGRISFDRALDRFCAAAGAPARRHSRHVLGVRAGGASERFGLFFGIGAVVRGIEFCHERIYRLGLRNDWAPGLALLRGAYGIARREPVFARGEPLEVEMDGRRQRLNVLMLLVSTLDRLFLGTRPFWGTGSGRLQATLLAEHPAHFLRSLVPFLRGRPNRHMTEAAGYQSGRPDGIRIRDAGRFTIDGEFYACEGGELEIRPAGPLDFLRLGPEHDGSAD